MNFFKYFDNDVVYDHLMLYYKRLSRLINEGFIEKGISKDTFSYTVNH